MGKLKLLTKSIIFSTRSRRRFFTFVIVFAILSGATIILISYFDNFSRQGLLSHKGIVVKTTGFDVVTESEATSAFPNGVGSVTGYEEIIYYKYVNFGTSLRIFSMDSKYPWAFTDLKPNNLISGHFPTSSSHALVSEDALLTLQDTEGANSINIKPTVGTSFSIQGSSGPALELTVSGVFRKTSSIESDTGMEWIFITKEKFSELIQDYLTTTQIYVHSITIIASGDVFSGQAYTEVDSIGESLDGLNAEYQSPIYTRKTDKDDQRNTMFLSLMFGIVGTFMVSTLYSYIITRFRRREVAVLKAMGYSKWDVRIVVLSEILVVAVTGFIIGIAGIQAYIYLVKTSSYVYYIIFSPTALLSFLAVVLSSIPGFLLITKRILGVRPIEIFRQK